MPGFPTPNSGGAPQPDNAGPKPGGYLPSGKPGGQITISGRESLALIAFDTEDDEARAIARARRETALDDDQLRRLKNRADKARAKGYTLTNGSHKFMPTNYDGDQDSLLGPEEQKGDAKNRPARDAARDKRTMAASKTGVKDRIADPAKAKKPDAMSTRRTQEAWASVHECDGDEMCGPCRAARAAAAPAREAYRRRMKMRQREAMARPTREANATLEQARLALLRSR